MKNLTDDRPKCLVEVRGRSLLDWQLESLRQAGIREISIVTGYKRELLSDQGLVEFFNPRWEETNMVSSLACAREWLVEGSCIVSYSDIFYDASAVISLLEMEGVLGVTYDPKWLKLWERRFGDPLLDAETFRLRGDSTLAEIGKRPNSVSEVQGQYMGLLRFGPAGWLEIDRIRAGLPARVCDRMDMTSTLQLVIEAGRIDIVGVPYEAAWGEVDSADDLAAYQETGVAGGSS